jgi:hypothetical protein
MRRLLPVALYAALGAILLAGAFRAFDRIGGKDWNAFLGQAQAEVTSIRDYGQFPLWNPWRRGGEVSFAQPESMFLSPVTPLALVAGVLPAFKLLLLPVFVLGCLGFAALARKLGLTGAARHVPALVFFGSSIFPLYVTGGLPNWLFGMAALPWLVLFQRRSLDDVRWSLAAGALWAGCLFCGSVHHFVFFPLVLAVDAAALALSRRSLRPVAALAHSLAFGACFAAVRVLPIASVFVTFSREIAADTRFLTPALVLRSLLDPRLPDLDTLHGSILIFKGNWINWINSGAYVGPLALALSLLGLVAAWRRTWPWGVGLLLFLWLTFGAWARPSLWLLLRELPVYASMVAPERLMLQVTFYLAIAAGFGLEAVSAALRRTGTSRLALFAVLAGVVVPPVFVNAPISRSAFIVDPTARPDPQPTFSQSRVLARPTQWGGDLYEAVLRNNGNVNATSDIPFRSRVRAEGDRGYRGEAYLVSAPGLVVADFTPNVIRATVETQRAGILVVNQNYFPGWQVSGSHQRVRCWDRLLAVPVAAGRHEIVLRFRSPATVTGAVLTLLAAALATLRLTLMRGGRRAPWVTTTASALLLVAGFAVVVATSERGLPVRPRWARGESQAASLAELLGIPTQTCAPGTRADAAP